MSRTRLQFYATPDEQGRWLREVLTDEDVWCVLRPWDAPPVVCPTQARFELELKFDIDQGARYSLMLGHRELVAEPIWRVDGAGKRDIDFARSQAIQYCPSVIARGNVLLEGQLAIMNKVYYDDLGLAWEPLQKWFHRVARSLKRLRASGCVLIHHTTRGTSRHLRRVLVTPGALKWRRAGNQLKQLVDGAVEFDIQSSQE
jgi:hypothetical protein